MAAVKIQYGQYIEEECCEDCNYAGGYNLVGNGMSVQICPDCGGQLVTTIGRWMYTETPYPWFDLIMLGYKRTMHHGFLKGRNTKVNSEGTIEFCATPTSLPTKSHE